MRLVIISFTAQGSVTATRLHTGLQDLGHESRVYSVQKLKTALGDFTRTAFETEDGIIFVGAAGIAVRSVAPFLKGKTQDPAVVVVDEQGNFAISLLSGHLGGANELAAEAASILGAQPVITTATDLNHAFAVDLFAKKNNLAIGDLKSAKAISASVLRGEPVGFFSDFPVEGRAPKLLTMGIMQQKNIYVTYRENLLPDEMVKEPLEKAGEFLLLRLIPRTAVLGIGCRRGISREAAEKAASGILAECGFDRRALWMLASIDLKEKEEALLTLAREWGLDWNVFSAEELGAVEGGFSESDFVKSVTGVGNVCERSALAGAGMRGRRAVLAAGKRIFPAVTAAVAAEEVTVRF